MLYVLLVLVLASFVIAFFSARASHWAYVLVAEFLFLATLGFFLLAAETVRINAVLRSQVNRIQKELDTVTAQNEAMQNGTENASVLAQLSGLETPVKMPENAASIPSLAELDHKLLIATRQRGRVWRNVAPAAPPNPQTGAVNVTLPAPVPAGIKADTIVYLFDDGPPQPAAQGGAPRGPQYLGEFKVTQAAAQQAALVPTMPLDEFQRRRLAGSRGPWIIYESMPLDRHEIFAGKEEPELKQKLPAKSLKEYLREGTPATADDDPLRVVGLDENGDRLAPADIAKATKKVYRRRLRDYASEIDALARRRVMMLANIDAVKKDIERLKAAQDIAKKLQAFREDERQKLTSDLAGINKEREAIDRHVEQLKKQIARARDLTAQLLRDNEQKVAELAARQLRTRQPEGGATSPAKSTGPLALDRR